MKPSAVKPRSPSIERICVAAVAHFAERGYDASSLNDIAEKVGIRKASLYTHFASKNDLFLLVFDDALGHELEFLDQCFAAEAATALPGSAYCDALTQRYDQSLHLQLLLRTAYLPPAALRPQVQAGYQRYLDRLFTCFAEKLTCSAANATMPPADTTLYGHAYLGIVDSLHVELIYAGPTQLPARWQALQRLLRDSLDLAAHRRPD